MKRYIFVIFIALFAVTFMSTVDAVSVQPMVIKIKAKPGETVPFKIKLAAKEKFPENINLSLVQPIQQPSGAFEFKTVEPETFPEIKWVSLNTPSIIIAPGQEREIIGSIKAPFSARGYHMVALLVEQPPQRNTEDVVLKVRYAVKIEINIDAIAPRPAVAITGFEMIKGDKGEPRFQFTVKNTSQQQYGMDASVILRNSNTKKLIQRIQLKPGYYWKNNYEAVIIPGSVLQFFGNPKEALLPGIYDCQLVFRYGTSYQIIKKITVEVKPGDFIYPPGQLRITRMDASSITFSAKPGASSMKGIKIENRSEKAIKVILKLDGSNISDSFSISKNTIFEFKNGKEFIIEPGRSTVAVVSVKFPKDARIQGNYGNLIATTFLNDGMQPIEESTIPVEAFLIGKHIITAEIADLSTSPDNDKILFSAIVKNTGNIKISPQVAVNLKNEQGRYVDSLQLTSQGDNSIALPTKLLTLTGLANRKLTPGKYKAEAKVLENDQEIGSSVFDVQVK